MDRNIRLGLRCRKLNDRKNISFQFSHILESYLAKLKAALYLSRQIGTKKNTYYVFVQMTTD